MNNLSKYSNKYKKYAFRKIGKFFGSCAVATVITLSGAAIMAPNVAVYASGGQSEPGNGDIHNLPSSNDGYEVIIPKGKKYIRNDEIESHTPVLKEEGYNGRSFIVPSENSVAEYPLSELFKKLYDKDGDDEIDDKYKDPKYPHVVDSGLTDDSESSSNKPGVWEYNPDGKYENSDGEIDENDNIVVARKPFTINEDAENNVVNDDGSVVLTGDYKIHVNEGDHIEAKDDVYEVGTKPKVERTPIPFETTYKRDDSVPEGTENEVTAGKDGETVKTTTYKLNPTTGEVTANDPTTATTDPVTRVVKKGTQPKVEKTPIPFETRYEEDNSIPEGEEREVTAGVNGETVKTTTYEINPDTGVVTANEPKTATTDPVTRVVKRGTQPKPGETPETPQPEQPGKTPETPQPEKPGKTPETPQPEQPGKTPENPQSEKPGKTPETPQPEQPGKTPETPQPEQSGKTPETPQPEKPGKTPETPQPKPGETPETPQPKPGETPETPQPEKPGKTPETPQPETGINVIPPTPRIVERSGGNIVEVEVPNKDADTLSITFTKRNSTEKETIVTKKDNGTWKIEKAPKGVTINPTNGLVYIPSKEIEPKTYVDTQTKHKNKESKIVRVVPNIQDLKEFEVTTEWIDVNGNVLKTLEKGIHEKEKFASYVWLESVLEGNKIRHIYFEGTPIVEKPEYKITVWFDKDGNPIKPDQPGIHESGEIPGYRFVTTTTTDGVTVHKFEKITPVDPNKPTPEVPTIPDAVPGKLTEKQQVKKLANTGATETNTGLAGLGLAMFGMALTAIKRRKEK